MMAIASSPSRVSEQTRTKPGREGGLAVYITSHGFGHLNRVAAVLNRLSSDIPLTLCCAGNLIPHWNERLFRPFQTRESVWDVGALGPPGDSVAVDGRRTLDEARAIHQDGLARLDNEAQWLAEGRFSAVLCDAPPLPLRAARQAGLPAFLLANFTWSRIYAPHAAKLGDVERRFVRELRECERQATAVFRAQPALVMPGLPNTLDVGLVAKRGKNRRRELRAALGLKRGDKLVYFYVGRYGQDNMGWWRLSQLAERGIHFVGFHSAPTGQPAPENLHVVDARNWTGGELAASCDAIVAKAGYGTCCDALVSRAPLIYPPRRGFAEFVALDRAMRQWGGGIKIPSEEFNAFRIGPALDQAFRHQPDESPYPIDGAERINRCLSAICQGAAVADAIARMTPGAVSEPSLRGA